MEKDIRTALTICRYWDNPQINVTISDLRISLDMPIEAFIHAMAQEMSSPITTLTRSQMEKRLKAAADAVVEKVKESSRTVV